jgi:multidrug resistance efflux pump
MSKDLENIDLRSEEVQEILTKVPNWMIRWGNVLFLAIIVMLFVISWFVKYPDIIPSEAIITTKIPPQKEYAKITDELSHILVEDSQIVYPNQTLAILESTANYLDVLKLKSVIDTIRMNTDSLSFPIDELPLLFLGDIESQYALFENSYIQYQLNKKYEPFSNEALANQYSISELHRRLQSLQSQKAINEIEIEFKKKNSQRIKGIYDKGVISTQEFEMNQLELAQAERNFKNFESSISQMRESISNAQKNSIGTEINRVREETILLKNVKQSFNQLKIAIKDWEYKYVFKSNITGKVSYSNFWNTNQTVNQDDLVFTIIPSENSSFTAKLKTPIQNSGKIKIGQRVNIKLENYPDAEFGVLNGNISSISLVPNKEGFYLIDVALPRELLTSYNKIIDFKYEMRGTAEIITEDLRLIERLFYQFKEVLNR